MLTACGNNCDYTKGILVHQANDFDGNTSQLLDMTPNDNNSSIVALLPSKSFTDSNAANGGVTMTVNSVAATGASVTVTFGGVPTCVRGSQSFAISPNTTQWVQPGSNASYTLTIQNNDSPACSPTTFKLAATMAQPSWVKAVLSTESVAVAPGQVGTVNLLVSSSTATFPSLYPVRISATSNGTPANTSLVTANFGVR